MALRLLMALYWPVVIVMGLLFYFHIKFDAWSAPKVFFVKAGVIGAVYGLLAALLVGFVSNGLLCYHLSEMGLHVDNQAVSLIAQLTGLGVQLALVQYGLDFALRGASIAIGIAFVARQSSRRDNNLQKRDLACIPAGNEP